MNSCNLTILISTVANVMADSMSDDELDLAAAALSQLGDTLSTISVLRSKCDNQNQLDHDKC